MSTSFSELRRYKQLGLSYSAVLVLCYLQEYGPHPVGAIADAVGCSTRCVEMAMSAIKRLGMTPEKEAKNISHDHDHHGHGDKGTAKGFSAPGEGAIAGDLRDEIEDPLMSRLCAYEVLPWCAAMVIQKIERGELQRQEVERQLAYHQVRLESGFKFRSHPARFLFAAILKGYAPPAEAQSQASHSGCNGSPVATQSTYIRRTFGADTLERRAEFEARARERQDADLRRRSLLAMFASQCRPERGPRRKTPDQLIPQLEKHGLSLEELLGAIACHEARGPFSRVLS